MTKTPTEEDFARLQAERDRAVEANERLARLGRIVERERDRLAEELQVARDALHEAYERTGHADDLAAAHVADLALPPPVKEAEPVNEVIVTPGDLQDLLIAAYERGAHDTHEHYQPDPDPCFKEAAWDYVASLDFTATTRPHRATPPALQARVEALEGALREAQSVLAMLVEPGAIQQTTVINAYAAAKTAEAKARAALTGEKG